MLLCCTLHWRRRALLRDQTWPWGRMWPLALSQMPGIQRRWFETDTKSFEPVRKTLWGLNRGQEWQSMPSESQCLHLSLSLSILFIYSCLSFLELSIIRDQYMLSFSYSSFSISPPLAFFFKPQASLSFSRSSLSVFAHQVHYFSYLFFLSLYKITPPISSSSSCYFLS